MIFNVEAQVSTEKTVVINEFMASNNGIVQDEAGENEDWIELYNTTASDVDLSGYFITDNPDNLTKFVFPEGTILKANEYLLIWADEDQEQGSLHANFKLSAGGESIILLDKQQMIIDSVVYQQQVTNQSAARIPNGSGPFLIGNHTLGINNDGTTSTIDIITNHLKVYPNPSSSLVTIFNDHEFPADVAIYSISGSMVSSYHLSANESLVIQHLTSGMYLISNNKYIQKLVVLNR